MSKFEKSFTDQTETDRFGRWLYILLVVAVLFFLFSVGFAVFTFFRGDWFVSAENVQLNLIGPETIDSGDLVELEIEILNRNTVALEEVELILEYPSAAREPDSPQQSMARSRQSLDDISAGGRLSEEVEFLFLGQPEDEGQVRATLEYSIPRSNARFTRQADYDLVIDSSPLSLSIRPLTDVHASQTASFAITVTSEAENDINNVLVQAEYPPGFRQINSSPPVSGDNNIWRLGTFTPGESKTIDLTGQFEGGGGEERTMRFLAGPEDGQSGDFLAVFTSSSRTEVLRGPQLDLTFSFPGGTAEELISTAGRQVEGEIEIRNNLSVDLRDVEVELNFSTDLVDPGTIRVTPSQPRRDEDVGFYDPDTDQGIWSYVDMRQLSRLRPGESFTVPVAFRFRSDQSALRALNEPQEILELEVAGRQTDNPRLSERVSADRSYALKLNTDIEVAGYTLYSSGPFENTGPIPPQVDEPTEYTIVLALSSSISQVEEVVVQADIPAYVDWLDNFRPAEDDLRYSSDAGAISWRLERLEAGRGFDLSAREVAFQIVYTPRRPHRREVVELLRDLRVRAVDAFTGETVEFRAGSVTTDLITDPEHGPRDGVVE